MAPINPPSYLQAGSYPARLDRLHTASLLSPAQFSLQSRGGVRPGPNGLRVNARSTPGMGVVVVAGHAHVPAASSIGGTFTVANDGDYDVPLEPAHPTLPRKDLIVARVYDATDDVGPDSVWDLEPVTGVAAASPVRPSTPAGAIALAEVSVGANATAITSAEIDISLRQYSVAVGGVLPITLAQIPSNPHLGQHVYRTDIRRSFNWDGVGWRDVFDANYGFPYGALARKIGDAVPDQNITVTTETSASARVSSMDTTFTVPPNVPSTRTIMLVISTNITLATGTEAYYAFWLDGSRWLDMRSGRRISNPADGISKNWSSTGLAPPPAAGSHSLQFRLWVDPANAAGSVRFHSGELSVLLL